MATLAVSPTALNLGSTVDGTPGSVQTFTVSGINLTGPITITAPTGVQLSANGGSSYQSVLNLTSTDGTVATTTIDVRIAASGTVGPLAEYLPGPVRRRWPLSRSRSPAPQRRRKM